MDLIHMFIDYFLHLDRHLSVVIQMYGMWTYLILFLVVFCETGLVVTPILPGDSLLFAAGAFAASGALQVQPLFLSLIHISEPTRLGMISYAVFCLKKKK